MTEATRYKDKSREELARICSYMEVVDEGIKYIFDDDSYILKKEEEI